MLYKALFSPIRIGKLMVKNRLVMSPMVVSLANKSGEVTNELINYYAARARGGVGLIIVEAACVDVPAGREALGQLNINELSYVTGLARLAAEIKAYSCPAFIQLFHAGRQTHKSLTGGVQPVAPSPIPCAVTREMPRELTIDEIEEIEGKFITAAYYAHSAGFDGVEIHAAHGYLINQFLATNTNQRTDKYGGELDNRMRILLNIVRKIKQLIPDLVISVRLNIDDFVKGGLEPGEAVLIAKALEKAGADLINCSAGIYESGLNSIEPSSYAEGWRVYLAQSVKSQVNIPVMTGGIIRTPKLADDIISQEKADLIFLGRTLLADPDWVTKARQGREEDIRPCIMCNNCIQSNFAGRAVTCTVNPELGREEASGGYYPSVPPDYKVAVIGAGPAGLAGAISLARLGIKVSLYEKADKLGGQLNLAHLPPYKNRIKNLLDYLKREISKFPLDLYLNHEFTPADLNLGWDMIIVAAGSQPKTAPFPIEASHCVGLAEVLTEKVPLKNQNIVVVGGGRNGCEAADFLRAGHNKITIVEQGNFLAADMEKKNRRDLMNRLEAGQVTKLTNSQVIQIINNQVKITSPKGEEVIKADCIIMAIGYVSHHELYLSISKQHNNVLLIGDAENVQGIKNAIYQGHALANLAYNQFKRGI